MVYLDRIRDSAGVGFKEQGLTLGDLEGISEKKTALLWFTSLLRSPVTHSITRHRQLASTMFAANVTKVSWRFRVDDAQ